MRNKVLYIIIMLLAAVPAAVAQNTDLRTEFERELKEKCSGVNSIECRFVQTRSAAVLVRNADKNGRYYFLQPYNVLLAFDDGDYIKITSTMFEIKQNGHTSSMKVASNPALKSLNRMLSACISGDASQIMSGFDAEVESNENEYMLRLSPQKGRSSKKTPETLLVFDRKDMSLKMMKMVEPTGDYLQYRFYDVKYNTSVEPSIFDIK